MFRLCFILLPLFTGEISGVLLRLKTEIKYLSFLVYIVTEQVLVFQ